MLLLLHCLSDYATDILHFLKSKVKHRRFFSVLLSMHVS